MFLDLLDQFIIREPETDFNNLVAECHANRFGQGSKALAQMRRVIIFQLNARNELSQTDPAIAKESSPPNSKKKSSKESK
ncbi:hypothetical protein SynA18461_00379 [Synechococcus sp. A18-46.1]|nr:hypothetical protein SynA18461_00379 [Synechococcus sp. A18-46.1]